MTEHSGLVECVVEDVTAYWKSFGGAAGLMRAVVKGICTAFASVAYAVFGLGLADMFLWLFVATLPADNVGEVSTPFAVLRFAYCLTPIPMFLLGFSTNLFVSDVLTGGYRLSRDTFTMAFIGVAAQSAVYTCMACTHAVYTVLCRPITGDVTGRYELYTLVVVAGKAAYLYWLNIQYAAFLAAAKKTPGRFADVFAEMKGKSRVAAEENEQSDEGAAEEDESEEHTERKNES